MQTDSIFDLILRLRDEGTPEARQAAIDLMVVQVPAALGSEPREWKPTPIVRTDTLTAAERSELDNFRL